MRYFMKVFLVVIFNIFLFALPSHAEKVTFVKEYTYQASELDSKASCRTISLEMVKRLLLEELGTYLISETEVKGFQLTKDKVTVLTAGIVRAEVVDEKWDGKTYWLKAKVSADPKEVTESLDNLRKDKEKTKEIEDARLKAKEALQEIDRLKKELEMVKTATATKERQEEYQKGINRLSAVDWFENGNSFFNVKKYAEAIEAYNKAIEFDIYYTAAYNNRGLAYYNKGQHDIAIADFNKAIEIAPNFATPYYNRGLANYSKKQYDRAIHDYNKAIEINPYYAVAYGGRGLAYAGKGQQDIAIADYTKAIDISPDSTTYFNRGFVYYGKGQYDRAIGDFNKAIELNHNFAAAYSYRGLAYYKKGQNDRAIEDFKIAAQLGDMDAQKTLNEIGIAWRTKTVKTTNKEKKDDYDKSGLSAKDWLERGIALSNSGKKSEAIDALSKAIELNPEEKLAYSYRGYAYAASKNFQKALDDFNTLVDIDPQDAETFHGRAFIYTQMGDYTRSFSDFELAFSKKPDSPIILAGLYSGRGFNYIKLHKYSEAIVEYSKAIELNPSVGMFYIGRAMAYRALKNYQKAIEDYDRVVFVDPQMSAAYYEGGILKMEVGNREKGIEDFKKAAELGHKEAQKKLNALGIDWLADSKTDSTLKSEISKESQGKYLYNPQPHAVQKIEYAPFLFEIRGCKSATDSITCDLVVINKGNKDRGLGISNGIYLLKKGIFSDTKTKPTRIVDNFGNEHKATLIQFGGKKEEKPQTLLVKDIPVRAVLIFDNISPLPSKLILVEVALFDDKDNIFTLRFSNIAVHDIKN